MKTAYDFQERMAAGKLAAERERGKDLGGSTVQVFATTTAMHARHGHVERDNFDHWLAAVRDRVVEICEHSRFTIYGEQWGEL
jgi:hypothetical protein